MSKEIKPGEWLEEKNVFGGTRRYRMTPYGKEYERTISTVKYGEVTESQLEAIHKREAEKKKELQKIPIPKESRLCPFKPGNRVLCRKECAFWSEDGCMKSADTKGKKCPISLYPCDDSCKLYDNSHGCSLIKEKR